jgi:GTPase
MSEEGDTTRAAPKGHRAGFCALLGPPNAGKSTFLNRALGVRIAAVSPKPQTTRNRILGVVNLEAVAEGEGGREALASPAQVIYVDTPGVQTGQGALRKFMREELHAAASECDVALVFADASAKNQRRPGQLPADRQRALDAALAGVKAPVVLALNKVDALKEKRELLPIIAAYQDTGRYDAIVPISALEGDNMDRLQREIASRLPEGPRLFPEEMITDRAERFLVGELIREQLFVQLGDELPYATAVVVESFKERKERGDVVINAVIHVERDSQKPIVLGRGGRRIKELGMRAREAVSQLLGCPAHVVLFVKVTPQWSRNAAGIREAGYER